jgi:hypothetical protein
VASAWPCAGHTGAPCVSTKKTSHFAKKPPGFGKFSREIQNNTSFVSFDALNLVKDF